MSYKSFNILNYTCEQTLSHDWKVETIDNSDFKFSYGMNWFLAFSQAERRKHLVTMEEFPWGIIGHFIDLLRQQGSGSVQEIMCTVFFFQNKNKPVRWGDLFVKQAWWLGLNPENPHSGGEKKIE